MAAFVLAAAGWAVPLNESFDLVNFPPVGWQSLQTGDGANVWIRSTGTTHSGTAKARSNDEDLSVGQVSERWLITPRLLVTSINDSIVFWARPYLSATNDDSVYVFVSPTNSLPASFTDTLAGYKCGTGGDIAGYDYLRFALSLEDYEDDSIYVAFLHKDPEDGGSTIYLDDVTGPELLEAPYPPSDPQPGDGAVSIGADTVLHWTNGAGTDSVDLYLAWTEDSVLNKDPAARKIYNQLVSQYDPPGNLESNQIYYWRVVTKNQFGTTDGDIWDFTVIGAPLAGSYDIGGGNNDYANFSEAVSALRGNGISASVTFNVYGTTYDEYFVIDSIAGASATDTILFTDASGTAEITYNHYVGASDGIVRLDNADYITFDGIDIAAVDSAFKCVSIHNGSTHNRFQNATFTQEAAGSGITTSVLYCVYIWGSKTNYNTLDNLTLKGAKTGVYMSSSSGANVCVGNVIQNCFIDSVWSGVYLSNGNDVHIRDNDIELDRAGNTSSAWGLEVSSSLEAGNSVDFYRNKVHKIVSTSSSGSGMVRTYGASGAINRVYNNFCYDFQTTGSAQVRAIYIYGDSEIYFNSIFINNVASTGTVYGVYIGASNRVENIRNNVFYNDEATNTAYNIYASGSSYFPDVLDYNAYYGSGTGYNAAYVAVAYANLAALQNGTTYEDHGVEGDPGFTSLTDPFDLHILNTAGLLHNNGVAIAGITEDFDEETRLVTPDIGADEYTYLAPAADYAAREFVDVQYLYPELTPVTIQVYVQNRGSSAQANVPVRLFYKNVQQDEILVSLDAYGVDTLAFDWTTPAARDTGILKAQCFLGGDAVPANDSVVTQVVVIGQPMHGTYDIGGGANHYANFTSAVQDITLRSVDGAVTFQVYGTTYTEAISIGEIPGASETNTITFVEHTTLDEPVVITYGSGTGTVEINGGDYITFNGIDIVATGSNTRALEILGGADYNTVKNCNITGASVSGSSNYGAYITGGGNDHNKLENAIVSGGYYGIRISGSSAAADVGNEVTNCAVTEGKYGAYAEYQYNLRVHDCDIQVGWSGAATEVYGLYVGSHSASCTTYFYANEIHNLRTSGSYASNGIYTSSSSGRVVAYNNFIYDFQATGIGALYGLRVPGGNAELYFNSVYVGDVVTTGGTTGINGYYQAGGTAILQDNIIQMSEPTNASWAVNRSSGTLTSDYNCFYGTGAAYNMGRDGTTPYATLALWQGGTGRDANSIEGNPGFVSAINLHIHPSFDLVDSAGVAITGITDDIDHNLRAGVPDIGADEYTYISIPHDLGVNGFVDFITVYDANLPYVIKAEVENYGANTETGVPVVLFYNGTPKDTVLLSLPSSQKDTVELDWLTPNVEFEQGLLEVQVFCPGDNYLDDDSVIAEVAVIAGPMSGTYDLGGGDMDFANFTDAVTSLELRGIDGPVTIDCYAGTYQENIGVPEIDGASFADRITFQAYGRDVVTLTAASGDSVLSLNGADFMIFDGINVTATGAVNTSILLRDGADYNTFKKLTVRGRDSLSYYVKGVRIGFLSNDNNLFDSVTVVGCYYGIRNEGGGSYDSSFVLEIRYCTILNARYGVYLDNVHNALVHDNDIQPGSDADNNAHTYGIYISSLEGSHVAYIYNNRIHNLRNGFHTSFPTVAAIETHPTGNAQAYIYNNFIYDFIVPNAEVHGIEVGTGTNHVYHNSIRINDVDATYEIAGIYQSTGTAELLNNIIVVEEATGTCYGIWRASGTLANSDYNCIYGTSPEFRVGRDGATDCPTLPNWQGFGYDPNSIVGDPGFVGATDLHIDPTNSLVDSAGVYLATVTTDIDGDMRDDPPDIGADEYDWTPPPGPVTNLTVFRETGTDNVILRWSAVLNANSYNIYAGDSVGFVVGPSTYIGTTGNTSYTHTGIVAAASRKIYVVLASSSLPGAVAIPPAENRRDR